MNAVGLKRFFKDFDGKKIRLVLSREGSAAAGFIIIEYREPWSRKWKVANSTPFDYAALKAILTYLGFIKP